jgi:hypothetical protein
VSADVPLRVAAPSHHDPSDTAVLPWQERIGRGSRAPRLSPAAGSEPPDRSSPGEAIKPLVGLYGETVSITSRSGAPAGAVPPPVSADVPLRVVSVTSPSRASSATPPGRYVDAHGLKGEGRGLAVLTTRDEEGSPPSAPWLPPFSLAPMGFSERSVVVHSLETSLVVCSPTTLLPAKRRDCDTQGCDPGAGMPLAGLQHGEGSVRCDVW